MDGHRFDELARGLARGTSRRGFVGGLAAVAASALGARATAAACPPDQVTRRGMGCVCRTTGRPPAADGYCPCPTGQTRCGEVCVDTGRDPDHCGGCGIACDDGDACTRDRCRGGQCVHPPLACDDGDPCTTDACDPATGCVFTPVADGGQGDCPASQVCRDGGCVPCGDLGQPCCAGDTCDSGALFCDGGSCVECRTATDCLPADACDSVTGGVFTPLENNQTGACPSLDVCNDGGCTRLGTLLDCQACGDVCRPRPRVGVGRPRDGRLASRRHWHTVCSKGPCVPPWSGERDGAIWTEGGGHD